MEVLEDTLDLRSVGAVVFYAVDEGRDGDAAGIRGTWRKVFERAALAAVSTAVSIAVGVNAYVPSTSFRRCHDVI